MGLGNSNGQLKRHRGEADAPALLLSLVERLSVLEAYSLGLRAYSFPVSDFGSARAFTGLEGYSLGAYCAGACFLGACRLGAYFLGH